MYNDLNSITTTGFVSYATQADTTAISNMLSDKLKMFSSYIESVQKQGDFVYITAPISCDDWKDVRVLFECALEDIALDNHLQLSYDIGKDGIEGFLLHPTQ